MARSVLENSLQDGGNPTLRRVWQHSNRTTVKNIANQLIPVLSQDIVEKTEIGQFPGNTTKQIVLYLHIRRFLLTDVNS